MTTGETYAEVSNKTVSAANGVEYVYRDAGEGGVPLVLLQHFRGNLDNWDPALIDELASSRRVVTFDNMGVGGTTGNTPHRVEQMAQDAIAFLSAMQFDQVDILGFSIGCSPEHRAATCPRRGKPDKLSTTPFVHGEFRITACWSE
jgi:pimeloyl-ACP methyl ester carboxylesterase